ncbi:MAG: ribosome assembly cofactor RimP [Muribaculaceae bacterium]|nr:ribosome assembly cofactor RimP [Muribaculaceae bacterium]
MIDSTALRTFIESRLEGSDYFLVDLNVTPDNVITVEIDTTGDAALDRCITLTREIEEAFDREKEDYELEVGSAGLTSPFKVKGQYEKHIGHEVEVLSADGRKYRGELISCDNNSFVIRCEEKVKPEGAKRPVIEQVDRSFAYTDARRVNYLLKF